MRALSLAQPYATLTVEMFPDRAVISIPDPTDYRGPLAIHAKARQPYSTDLTFLVARLYGLSVLTAFLYTASRSVPHGAIVGVGTVVDCISAQRISVGHAGPRGGKRRIAKRDLVGTPFDNHVGRWMLVVEGLRALELPVRCRGRKGLWAVPNDPWRLVAKQLTEPAA